MAPEKRRGFLRRATAALVVAASLSQIPAASARQGHPLVQPFLPVETARAQLKRQDQCLANFYSCSGQGAAFDNVCCQNGQACTTDTSHSAACCPKNAVCTGTAPATFVTPTAGPTTAVSYVPNSYFSFPYIATSFDNPGACSAALSQCSRNYDTCTAQLGGEGGGGGGGGGGVTIVVPGGGGTTVAPGGQQASVGGASATSVCSSLSSAASCGALNSDLCTNRGTSTDGFLFGTGSGNVAARPTAACHGVGMGVAGVVAAGFGLGVV